MDPLTTQHQASMIQHLCRRRACFTFSCGRKGRNQCSGEVSNSKRGLTCDVAACQDSLGQMPSNADVAHNLNIAQSALSMLVDGGRQEPILAEIEARLSWERPSLQLGATVPLDILSRSSYSSCISLTIRLPSLRVSK